MELIDNDDLPLRPISDAEPSTPFNELVKKLDKFIVNYDDLWVTKDDKGKSVCVKCGKTYPTRKSNSRWKWRFCSKKCEQKWFPPKEKPNYD
jgi:hypothetical protein